MTPEERHSVIESARQRWLEAIRARNAAIVAVSETIYAQHSQTIANAQSEFERALELLEEGRQ
jgi:hypothetical protein